MSKVEIERNEVKNLPFGTKLRIMINLENGYTTAYGVKYGNKIGYTDGTNESIQALIESDIIGIYLD